MSFEAVRQIVESRIFSESYTTVIGDTLESIASDFNQTTAAVTRFNPNVNFSSSLILNFDTNDTRNFQFSSIEGFSNGGLGTGFTDLQFRGSAEGGNTSFAGTVNKAGSIVRLFSQISSTDADLSVKVNDWVNLINGESSFRFTATIITGGNGIELSPKDEFTFTPIGDLTVASRNNYGLQELEGAVASGIVLNLGSTLPFPIFLESRNFTQPTGDNANWAVLFINDAAVVGREFGNPRDGVRRSGTVRIALYAPRNKGTKLIRDMAAEFDRILSYTAGDSNTGNGGTFFMKAGSLTRVSDDEDGSLSYNLDYIYDYYTTST